MTPKLGCVLALSLFAVACAPEQVVLHIDTSLGVPCDLDEVRVEAEGIETRIIEVTDPSVLPGTLTFERAGETLETIVTVRGFLAGQEVAMGFARLRFSSTNTLLLRVELHETCPTEAPGCDWSTRVEAFRGDPAPLVKRVCGPGAPVVVGYRAAEPGILDTFRNACELPGAIEFDTITDAEAGAPPELIETLMSGQFSFYGEPVQNVWLGDNGYVSFAAEAPDSGGVPPGALASTAGVPRMALLPFWDELAARDPSCVALTGSAPRRKLLVSWSDACFGTSCQPSASVNFTATLDEESGDVTFLYGVLEPEGDASAGLTATVGLVGRNPLCSECGTDGLCMDGGATGQPCGFLEVSSRRRFPEGRPAPVRFVPVLQ